MGEYIYTVLEKYFMHLKNYGHVKECDVKKVLVLTAIQDIVEHFAGYITEEDYKALNNALYCLFGSSCLMPYPDLYSANSNKVFYSGAFNVNETSVFGESIFNLGERLQQVESALNKDIIVPGLHIEDVNDLEI